MPDLDLNELLRVAKLHQVSHVRVPQRVRREDAAEAGFVPKLSESPVEVLLTHSRPTFCRPQSRIPFWVKLLTDFREVVVETLDDPVEFGQCQNVAALRRPAT